LQLSVIIVNYNVKYFLEQCLCSVYAALQNIEAEVFVVDNNSSDNSIDYLQTKYAKVNFIKNERNVGFAKANNQAASLAKGKYILFLNPDTILPENSLIDCVNFLEQKIEAGAVGVRMIDGGGVFLPESKRSFPTPSVSFFKLSGLSALFPTSKVFAKYSLGHLSEFDIHEVDVLSGAFIVVKQAAFASINGFDEQFFMYGEDIDLSYRLQKSGFKNYYLGNISIVHFKGESTKKGNLNYIKMFYTAMIVFVKKHYSTAHVRYLDRLLNVAILFRAFISAVTMPFEQVKETLKPARLKTPKTFALLGDVSDAKKAKEILLKKFGEETNYCFSKKDVTAIKEGEVIFCLGNITYKEAINLLQKITSSVTVKWFGKNTKSITGSMNKNISGEVYSLH
jgi:GT2 family glycosyltransferase